MAFATPLDLSATEDVTITGLLRRNARDHADRPALTSGIGPDATTWTWSRLRAETAALAHGLAGLGLARGERMLIAMSKRPEHWIADLAAVHLGAPACTTYDTLSTEQLRFVARHSAATVVVLEDAGQLERWGPALAEMDRLRAVVLVEADAASADDPRCVAYADLIRELPDEAAFEELTDAATPDTPLTIVYTSGTTGDPKGVVLTHRNVIYESVMQDRLVAVPEHPRSVAYLPLAHIAERVLGIYMPICNVGHVTLCDDPAQLLPTLRAVRPHAFFGVPRVWEKLAGAARARIAALPPEEAAALARAQETAVEVYRLRSAGRDVPDELAARLEKADAAVLRPVRAAIGFDDCHRAFSGAAPIPTAVLEFLAGLGLSVYEVWGLSETTGAATISTPEHFTLGAVGRPGPGIEVRTGADGELFLRGPVVCAGYLRADGGSLSVEPATDADGWLATGDVGSVDARGLVTVTDRKKELIITAGGKNIAPTRLESLLRAHPLIGQAAAIGDRRRYVTALLVLDEEAVPTWAKANGIDLAGTDEPARHPAVRDAVARAVADANAVLARVEQIKKYRLLSAPWTPESGELTPKLSLRRTAIAELHARAIESMYAED
ncbi:AMP-dependent synthetase/ligase [Streptomyces sp. BBFR2]|uniref:AMP-dependent synthetase/ligase n=1 Tax=Streptomyces sp. BBFR2 TaxID=3372854 RepID=UPI0037D9F144